MSHITNLFRFPGSTCACGLICAACIGLTSPAGGQDFGDDEGDSLSNQVSVSPYLTVEMHVKDTDLANVLQMLSLQSRKNIIPSSSVSATVSADLYDVTFYDALDAILHTHGYGYIEKGNFIYVYTQEELDEIILAERKIVTHIFRLDYLTAADAGVFLESSLSDAGSIALSGEAAPGFDPDETDGGATSWAYGALLVVRDYQENVDEIANLLEQLDIPPMQVLVEATVLQTMLTEDNAWGIDWNIIADADFVDLANPLSVVDDLLSGSEGFQPVDNQAFGVGTSVGRTRSSGGLKLGIVSNDISIFLRVLDEVTDTFVLSRPKVLVLNQQRGEILIGRRIGYLSTTSTQTSTTQTVQFLDTGTQLIFRPFISSDGYIRLELRPSVSEGIIREVTTAEGLTTTIPDEITQELITNVRVKDGYTIVLGGLFKEETTVSRRQVPILGDLPLIGAAFKGREDTTRRSEITFLITPSIMRDNILVLQGEEARDHVELARLGVRKEVLWWSNERLTAQHNMRAEQYVQDGDDEMALFEINRSLSLNHDQPEVRRLREQITGRKERYHNRSLLDYIISQQMIEQLGMTEAGQWRNDAELGGTSETRPIVDPIVQEFFNEAPALHEFSGTDDFTIGVEPGTAAPAPDESISSTVNYNPAIQALPSPDQAHSKNDGLQESAQTSDLSYESPWDGFIPLDSSAPPVEFPTDAEPLSFMDFDSVDDSILSPEQDAELAALEIYIDGADDFEAIVLWNEAVAGEEVFTELGGAVGDIAPFEIRMELPSLVFDEAESVRRSKQPPTRTIGSMEAVGPVTRAWREIQLALRFGGHSSDSDEHVRSAGVQSGADSEQFEK